ncbi:NAD(P)-dependent oxidoreductase [Chlorobium sp. KB01]|uniref:NAD-dependent epimerase/dehydratase family protein n=1 Tax=Chlorobium sp. KB01 TaxID=1917528 RepID=UPI0018E9CA29|nr:NAD(P)-dependent oxidoreductase [Chlorobium sp. KB01]
MIKVALTGATGFIGRHVLAVLNSHNGVDVIAVAREFRAKVPVIRNGYWVQMDISQPPVNVFEALGCPDILIHLAWHGLPNYRSLRHFEAELPIQYAFLKQLVQQGLKSVVVTGTCFEYGMQSGPLSEEIETRPANPYGFAKDTLRKQLQYLQAPDSFNLTWARLFYMYGDGQSDSSLIPQLTKAVERGDKVFNMSGGEQLRDYLPVTAVAEKMVSLALKQQNIGTINICSGKPLSVRNLVEQRIRDEQYHIELNLGFYPYPDYEPIAFWGDTSRFDHLTKVR